MVLHSCCDLWRCSLLRDVKHLYPSLQCIADKKHPLFPSTLSSFTLGSPKNLLEASTKFLIQRLKGCLDDLGQITPFCIDRHTNIVLVRVAYCKVPRFLSHPTVDQRRNPGTPERMHIPFVGMHSQILTGLLQGLAEVMPGCPVVATPQQPGK